MDPTHAPLAGVRTGALRGLRRALAFAVLVVSSAVASAITAPVAGAQLFGSTDVSSELFHRVVDGEVRVVLEIDVDDGFHVYHAVSGPGFAKPTVVTLDAPGVTFGDAVFPPPDVEVQAGLGDDGGDTFVWGHHGTFHVLAVGRFDGELEADSVSFSISGQVCDVNGCVDWQESGSSAGRGASNAAVDAIFAGADWAAYDANWPFPLAALQPRVLAALASGNDAQALVDEAIAAAAQGDAGGLGEGELGGGLGFGGPENMAFAEFFHRVEGDQVRGVLRIEIDPGYHLYNTEVGPGIAEPTAVTITAPAVRWNEVVFPEPEPVRQPGLGPDGADTFVWGFHDTVVARVTGTLAQGASAPAADDIQVAITGQTCDENGCVPYDDVFPGDGSGSDVEGVDALFAAVAWDALYENWPRDMVAREAAAYAELGIADPGANAASGAQSSAASIEEGSTTDENASDSGADGLWALIFLAISGGLFALVMPCTYPMIPITISYFTKQAEAKNGRVWPLALVYGGGITAMFTAIGLIVFLLDYITRFEWVQTNLGLEAGDAGSAIIAFAISGWFNLIIGVAFVYFALVLFGAINLNPPQWAMRMVGSAQGKGGIGGLFLMGFLLVVTSFTCTGPFVGTILGTAAQQGGTRVLLGMFVFGLTLATPFVILGMVPGRVSKLPKAGAWMNTMKVTLGFVELAAALKFFSNADIYWKWNVLPRELFFLMWGVIAFVIALFLFGQIRMKGETGEVGPSRMTVGAAFSLLGAYFVYGGMGNQMGGAMTALAPPYSARIVNQPRVEEIERKVDSIYEALSSGVSQAGGGLTLRETGPVTIVDDLEAAAQKAKELERALLVNFTGHI